MEIAIFGTGYVGLTAAACLTKQGHTVVGYDVNGDKVKQINAGEAPISEPGLQELIADAVKVGKLRASTVLDSFLDHCEAAIVCVGTPSAQDGSHNMTYIAEVSRQIAAAVKGKRRSKLTVIYRSTIRPGTMEDLIAPIMLQTLGNDFSQIELVYNPEFLRESVAIKDFFNPPKIVIGTKDGRESKTMTRLNEGIDAPTFVVQFRAAEFTKFIDNTFHALKVAFANEIGRICTALQIDAQTVHQIFVSDTKLNISPYYLRPGGAFGGSCLPKDVRALQHMSLEHGISAQIISEIIKSNESHKTFLFDICKTRIPKKGKVLLLGLAFKAESDDMRESPNIDLARRLLQAGHELRICDPALNPTKLFGQNLGYGYTNLPTLDSILIPFEEVDPESYDAIIDTNGLSERIPTIGTKLIRLDRLAIAQTN